MYARGINRYLGKNIMENLESGILSYIIVEEFGKGDDKIMKIVELKKVEQENRMIKEFIQ